jgi:hypothetical protein
MKIRKFVTIIDETLSELQQPVEPPRRRVVALAVFENPYAGRYADDLSELFAIGRELGTLLTRKGLTLLGLSGDSIDSYGKGAIVGMGGEIEHAAAVLHPQFGQAVRTELGGGRAIIPSCKKLGIPGTSIDIPLFFKEEPLVISHIDSIEARASDGPDRDEILVALALADSGRLRSRSGGLTKEEVLIKSNHSH